MRGRSFESVKEFVF